MRAIGELRPGMFLSQAADQQQPSMSGRLQAVSI